MFLCVTRFCADLQSYRHQSEFWEMTSVVEVTIFELHLTFVPKSLLHSDNYQKKKDWQMVTQIHLSWVTPGSEKTSSKYPLTSLSQFLGKPKSDFVWLILNLTVKLISTSCCNLTAWQSCHSPAFLCVVLESPYGGNDKHSSTQTLLGCVSDSPGGDYKRCSAWSSEGIILLENGIPHINCAWQIKGRKGWETWGPSVIMPLVQHCSRQQD